MVGAKVIEFEATVKPYFVEFIYLRAFEKRSKINLIFGSNY